MSQASRDWSEVEARLRSYVVARVQAAVLQRSDVSQVEMAVVGEVGWAGAVSALTFLVANPDLLRQLAREVDGGGRAGGEVGWGAAG